MSQVEQTVELVLALLVGVTFLTALAKRIGVAYPLVLLLGGLLMAAAPQIPDVELHPDLVLVLFLPPLLFADAMESSWPALRAELRPIGSLAIGLVLATALGVAAVARLLMPGLPWPCAFVLGAVLSPTDAVAAGAIAHALGLPRRLLTLVQGEALVNDATGLVACQFAIAAVVAGGFSPLRAGGRFLYVAAVGAAVGALAGFLLGKLLRFFEEPVVAVLFLVLGAYAAYLPAESLHASGVLAVVAAGLFAGRAIVPALSASTRLTAGAVLRMVTFLVNGLIFILLGLQLSTVTAQLPAGTTRRALLVGLACALATVLIRFAWVLLLGRFGALRARAGRPGEAIGVRGQTVLAWAGMRGVLSLAVALGLPLQRADGAPFPFREELVFAAFVAIVATLLVQGLSLGPLIRRLGVGGDGRADAEAMRGARRLSLEAAQRALDALEPRADPGELAHARRALAARLEHAGRPAPAPSAPLKLAGLLRESLRAQRGALRDLRGQGAIAEELLRELERELDLEELRLGEQAG